MTMTMDGHHEAWDLYDKLLSENKTNKSTVSYLRPLFDDNGNVCSECNKLEIVLDHKDGSWVCSNCGSVQSQIFDNYDDTMYFSDNEDMPSSSVSAVAGVSNKKFFSYLPITKEENFYNVLYMTMTKMYPWILETTIKQINGLLWQVHKNSDQIFRTKKRIGLVASAYWITMAMYEKEYFSLEHICKMFKVDIGQLKRCISILQSNVQSVRDYLKINFMIIFIKMYISDCLRRQKQPTKHTEAIYKMYILIQSKTKELKISKQLLSTVCCYIFFRQKNMPIRMFKPQVISIAKHLILPNSLDI